MKNKLLIMLLSNAVLLQACTPPTSNATNSSVSSAQSSASSHSSISSASALTASLNKAKTALSSLNNKLTGMINETDFIAKYGHLLKLQHQAEYAAFAQGLKSSNLLITTADGDLKPSDDVHQLLDGFAVLMDATSYKFFDTIVGNAFQNTTGIDAAFKYFEATNPDGSWVEAVNFTWSGTYNVCPKEILPCNVKMNMDLDMMGDVGLAIGSDKSTLHFKEGYKIKINQLTVAKGDVSLGIKPGASIILDKYFKLKFNFYFGLWAMHGTDALALNAEPRAVERGAKIFLNEISPFNMKAAGLNLNLPFWIKNEKTGYSVNFNLGLSSDFDMDLTIATDSAPLTTLVLNALASDTKFNLSAEISNAAGDKLMFNSVAALKKNGTSPITFTKSTDKPIKRLETASDYVGLDATINFDGVMSDTQVLSSDINLSRTSSTDFALTNTSINLDDEQFELNALMSLGLDSDFKMRAFRPQQVSVNYLTQGLKTKLQYSPKVEGADLLDSHNQKLGEVEGGSLNYQINFIDNTVMDFSVWK